MLPCSLPNGRRPSVESSAQIRAAATKLFAAHGFEGVSLQTIADEVGVAKQTLLYHYPSKDALRRAVVDQVFEHWRRTLPAVLQAITRDQRRFSALTEELIRFFAHDRNRALLLARELLDNPGDTMRLMAQSLRPWILLVAEYIREGQKLGHIRQDVDPEPYVLHVIIMVIASVANLSAVAAVLGSADGDTKLPERRYLDELVRVTHTALFVR